MAHRTTWLRSDFGAQGYLFTSWGNVANVQFPIWSFVPVALAGLYSWNTGEYSHFLTKTENVRMAEAYVDNEIFGAPVSELLHRLQRYYLLEPEIVHDSTISFTALMRPIDQNIVMGSFDLQNLKDTFYFDNIIDYVEKILPDVEKLDVDDYIKDQIKCNAKTIIFAEELYKLRIDKNPLPEKIDSLVELADYITETFDRLWEVENFTNGKEIFINEINKRRAEILELKNCKA